jgi:hypothetical protein
VTRLSRRREVRIARVAARRLMRRIPPRSEASAGAVAVLLVVFASAIGVAVGIRARETPAPRPSPTTIALPSATPLDPAETLRRAFAQPLTAGCATKDATWVVADGGAPIRYDGRTWTIPDPTLRSLVAAACDQATVLAVGRGGSLLTIDDTLRQIRVDRFGTDDFSGIAVYRSPRSTVSFAIAVGVGGTVAEQSDLGWDAIPTGTTTDLHSVARKSPGGLVPPPFAWIVGAQGVTFRLMEQGRWERVSTGTSATLRSVVLDVGGALAVGDRGTILRYLDVEDQWRSVGSGTDATLRSIAIVGLSTAWIVGDRGTVLELSSENVRRVDIGTTCTLRAVFADGSAIWVIGSDETRGGVWRIAPAGTTRWGTC